MLILMRRMLLGTIFTEEEAGAPRMDIAHPVYKAILHTDKQTHRGVLSSWFPIPGRVPGPMTTTPESPTTSVLHSPSVSTWLSFQTVPGHLT